MKHGIAGLFGALLLGISLSASASPLPAGVQLTDEVFLQEEATSVATTPATAPTGLAARSDYQPSAPIQAAVNRLNQYRQGAGLGPVVLTKALSEGCQAHAHYLTLNSQRPGVRGLGAHSEQEGLPGYTPQGAAAAANSVIAFGRPLAGAVEDWMATLYHRIPLLSPNLRRIGLGQDGGITVLDALNGVEGDASGFVAYPAAGQTDVGTLLPNELPCPLPTGASPVAGFPITLQFPTFGPEAENVQAELTDNAGRKVPFHLSDPQRPATTFPQQNTICLIPVRPLAPAATFQVSVSARVNGQPFTHQWSFTTRGGQTLASAR